MEIKEIYEKYRDYVLFFIVLIITILGNLYIYEYFTSSIENIKEEAKEKNVKDEPTTKPKNYVVDIKGEVKKPGVYTLKENDRVIDVVKKAGGFTKYADASSNNLSKKIKDEMVIVIYSKDEINSYLLTKEKEQQKEEKCTTDIIKNDSCIENKNKEENKEVSLNENNNKETNLININTATKEELTTISGIGDSKAESIIAYRKEHKFETIEDIKNVSGIGDSLYEKIKDYITT